MAKVIVGFLSIVSVVGLDLSGLINIGLSEFFAAIAQICINIATNF